MKKIIALSLFLCVSLFDAIGQDKINTNDGELGFFPILHGTLVMTWNDITIFVDPYGGAEAFANFGTPDLIFITDIHGDHLHLETLKALNTAQTTFVVPQAVAIKLADLTIGSLIVIENGESKTIDGIPIEAVPMYNLPETADSRHPKGRGNGYLLTIGGKHVYMSGDTEDIPEMRTLKNIDVAFVCMNLPYTMDIDQAASAVLDFKPDIVYPYHYRGQNGLADVKRFRELVRSQNQDIEVRLRNWYP